MFKTSPSERVFGFFNISVLLVLSLCFIYPFWHTLVLSFSSVKQAMTLGLKLFPMPVSLDSYARIFSTNLILTGYINTLIRTLLGTVLTLLVTFSAAYALAKKELVGRETITLLILFTMFFNGGLIATYLNIRDLHLMGSRLALILPLATSAWNLVIARNFISSLPVELEESAYLEGAGPIKTMLYIILPLSKPILAVLALWTAVAHWNAWFDAMLFVNDRSKMVLQLVLRSLIIEENQSMLGNILNKNQMVLPESVKAATIMISIGPIILLYPFMQRYFIKGILIGSLKG